MKRKLTVLALVIAGIVSIMCIACSSDSSSDSLGSSSGRNEKISSPTGLKASSITATASSITLKWSPVDNASYYNVQYSEDKVSWTSVGQAISRTYVEITDLSACTTYYFRVKAISSSSSSGWSSSTSAKTKIAAPSVMATKSGTTISLTVGKVKGADHYSIHYGTSSDFSSATYYGIAKIDSEQGGYFITKVTGLASGKTYYFFVTAHALNSNGDSATGTSQPIAL